MSHIQGMGITGSLLAWELDKLGITFTWSDNNSPITAWKASTGAIYPSGHEEDMIGYNWWLRKLFTGTDWNGQISKFVETCGYWFNHKSPPHEGKYKIAIDLGFIRKGEYPSFHLNSPKFIKFTRDTFASRSSKPTAEDKVVVAHGFNKRLTHYYWGWSAKVDIDYSAIKKYIVARPSFYFKQGRFVFAYAYPIPHERYWWAGSVLMSQKVAKSYAIQPKFANWMKWWFALSEKKLPVGSPVEFYEGWRPAGDPKDTAWVKEIDGQLVVKPLWNSGIRHGNFICDAVINKAKEKGWI